MEKSGKNSHHKLAEKRCGKCDSLLAKASLKEGKIEIKCSRCGTMNTFEANDIKPEGPLEMTLGSVSVTHISNE